MNKDRKEAFLQSVYGKVIAAFFIGVVAIGAAGLVSKVGFKEMLETVESLSAPNAKLRIINSLFYRVTQLEQLQHANAIESPQKSIETFSPEIQAVKASVDSLRELCIQVPSQLARVDSMALILQHREKLSESYFTLRADLDKNQKLNSEVVSLSKKLETLEPKNNNWTEKNKVVTTTKKTTTTTLVAPKSRKEKKQLAANGKKESFFRRLFSFRARKKKIKKGTREVREDIRVKIDTFSVARQYNSVVKVERELRTVERNFYQRNADLLAQELALVKTSHELNRQFLNLLKDFEAEEVGQVKGDYLRATGVVNSSVSRMNTITIIFFLGAALFAFLIVLDIFRGNKLRKALQVAKEEAEHLSQVKQRFLANMSHELRTPLQSILGFSEQVKNDKNPSRDALDAIYYSAEHLLQIVNEVLDYSRIISGKFTFVQEPFDVKQITKEVVTTLTSQANKKQLQLEFSCEESFYVSGDPFRLKQVLFNLVGNAIKFTDKGAVYLTVTCKPAGEKIMFSFIIKDTGIGIPEQDINRIFNQFEQSSGNNVQKHGGTGLGLSIAKSLVESQGGTLKVTSKVGQGSVFEIQLPFITAEKPVTNTNEIKLSNPVKFAGEVLLIDDDAIILKLCGAILNKHNIKNHCHNSSFKVAETAWPDTVKFVFTDIQMPGMNGFELSKILRKKLPADAKIYALTARALPEEHADILAHGFDGILMKPFREQQLIDVLNSYKTAMPEANVIPDFESNFSTLSMICNGDEQMFESMLTLFVEETRADLDLLAVSLAKDLPEQASEIVHKLAGCVGQMGAKNLYANLKQFEQSLKSLESVAPVKPNLKQTVAEIEILIEQANAKIGLLQEVLN